MNKQIKQLEEGFKNKQSFIRNLNQMQKFQDLLTEAAQLKQEQLKQERKNFEALPEYLKSGLNYAKKYVQLRKQHYLVQKYISQKLKTQGNDQYLLENYGQALSKYQQALSVFRFIHAKKYENLKDEDIIYENYKPEPQFKQEHESHLVALYLNICSALTKMNKKDEAVHSSEQALKINDKNPKIYYKKAQAYLQYINRQSTDIKVGFYYLNKAYELSKDQSILVQMHKIKKQLDEEREKQKNWFKFMFDKNKNSKENSKATETGGKQNKGQIESNPEAKQSKGFKPLQQVSRQSKQESQTKYILDSNVRDFFDSVKANHEQQSSGNNNTGEQSQSLNEQTTKRDAKSDRMREQFERFRQENQNHEDDNCVSEIQKLQKTKLSLKPYLIVPRDDRWLIKYQEDFIHKHGSKIYSILQLYNYSEYLVEFKSLLAKCLELKQAKITSQRDENKLLQQKITMYQKFVDWVKKHPVEKYKRYIERYELQTKWIQQNRGKPLDQVYAKQTQKKKKTFAQDKAESRLNEFLDSVRSANQTNIKQSSEVKTKPQQTKAHIKNNKNQKQDSGQEMLQKEEQISKRRQSKQQLTNKNTSRKYPKNGFKEQWQCNNQQQSSCNQDEIPPNLRGFLQNYEDFPKYQKKLGQPSQARAQQKDKKQHQREEKGPKNMQEQMQTMKENPFSFVKTLIVVLVITLLGKLIF